MNVDLYRRLFVHRDDVYACQQTSGAYLPVKAPLDDLAIAEHLEGFVSYGVYTIRPSDQTVTSIVFDLDTYDLDALDFLTRAVERLVNAAGGNSDCLLLEDSGGKGYHIWLLLSEPVLAAKARAFAEPIRAQYQSGARTAVGEPWPALEIFPKQDVV